jgi:fructose-1,6-bisphosphatase
VCVSLSLSFHIHTHTPTGLSVGSIFGVFRAQSLKDIRSGLDLVAGGYSLYSAALQFVWASSDHEGAVLTQFDFHKKEWIVATEKHIQPLKGKTYCINEGSASNWNEDIRVLVSNHLKGRSIRWMACMVADVHRPLMEGGAFMYPCDKKYTKGRLRLVYEAYPMAFLWEKCTQKGGLAVCRHSNSSGGFEYDRILKVPFPHGDVHSRCGVILLGPTESEMFKKSVEVAAKRGVDWGKF